MYDEAADEPCQVAGLLDELGAITHVFSDKTGTLTSNHMEFRRCLIGATSYGSGTTSISAALDEARSRRSSVEPAAAAPAPAAAAADGLVADGAPPPRGLCACPRPQRTSTTRSRGSPSLLRLLAEGDGGRREAARAFVLHLALNHSVLLEESDGVGVLGVVARRTGLRRRRRALRLRVRAPQPIEGRRRHPRRPRRRPHEVELLEVFDYESSRKRMSVVVRLPVELPPAAAARCCTAKGRTRRRRSSLRGTTRTPRRRRRRSARPSCAAHARLHAAAMPQFEEWHAGTARRWSRRRSAKHREGQPGAITALQSELEKELTFQGATAIEDKLQDGVPEVLADLRLAGIKVWMLTEMGTAKNIATACNILPPDARVTELTDEVYPQLKKIKQQDLIQAPPHPPRPPPARPHRPHRPPRPAALLTASGRSSAGVPLGARRRRLNKCRSQSHPRPLTPPRDGTPNAPRRISARTYPRAPTRVPTARRPPVLTSPSHRSSPAPPPRCARTTTTTPRPRTPT